MPIARNREFISVAAERAAGRPPPAATIASEANCADPAKTIADMRTACHGVIPAWVATTPKESDTRNPAPAYPQPARRPRRNETSSNW